MARKRMISPEIWDSQNFSTLSDLAKIVFISLFSHADDEGRGRADPTYIKSSTFPYDEGRRVADIKSALSEIARSMSVQFYSVNGIEFYFMTSWARWQKIDKPSKSKFPPPPIAGEGGAVHSSEKFDEPSTNIRRTLDEDSPPNRNKNRKENMNRSSRCLLTDEDYKYLCDTIGKSDTDYYIERVDAFKESRPEAQFNVKATILKWHREDKAKAESNKPQEVKKSYTAEQLNDKFNNIPYEDL